VKILLPLLLVMSCANTRPDSMPKKTIKTQIPAASREISLAEQYNEFLLTYPSEEKVGSCKSINFRSDRRVRRNQKNLFLNNPQMAIPNYNGIYLLLENPIGRGSEWFVVNCKTGRFETVFPVIGEIQFRPESRLIVTKTFGDFDTLKTFQVKANGLPQIYEWRKRKWVQIDNRVQK
jgi:hypothetical protein